MSSAILYLAIVAIWAGILVPRWVRRTHPVVQESLGLVTIDEDLPFGTSGALATDTAAAAVSSTLDVGSSWLTTGRLRSWHRQPADALADESEDVPVEGPVEGSVDGSVAPGPAAPAPARTDRLQTAAVQPSLAQQAPARPRIARSAILQARRRMLTTLVTLAIAAVGCTATGLTSWWVCLPPAGMLGMYLLLLREAAHADADSHRQHLEAAAARAARQRARAAWAAHEPERTAQIIDISSRMGDQLYDQYDDATVRAVGD